MSFVKKYSMRNRVLLIVFITNIVSVLVGFILIVVHDYHQMRARVAADAGWVAEVMEERILSNRELNNRASDDQILSNLQSLSGIECAFLYDYKGKIVSFYERSGCFAPQLSHTARGFRDNAFYLFHSIARNDEYAGTLFLRFSIDSVSKLIYRRAATFVSVLFIVGLVCYGISLRLQSWISRPLLSLARATQRITEDMDYSIRVPSDSQDELGILTQRFNTMVQQIEKRKAERDHAEQSLRESEDRYRSLVEFSPEGILLEKNDEIVYANSAALRLIGVSSVMEIPRMSIILNENSQIPIPAISKSGLSPSEQVLIRKDATSLQVEVTVVQAVFQGEIANQYLIRDITESKGLQEAAQRMERLAALGEFSAMLAHEMRNSIGSIALNVRTLCDRLEASGNHTRAIQNMERAIDRSQQLIKSILDFARPALPRLQRIEIHKLLENTLHSVEEQLSQSEVSVIRKYDQSNIFLDLDSDQMSHVFLNLILNAKAAMENGGTITIITTITQNDIRVRFCDTGVGIQKENLEKIFNPFFTTKPQGAGLGLAFVARILEQHGARILVESKPGLGSIFSVVFQRRDAL
jgi:PAS domain S-box-containing protein